MDASSTLAGCTNFIIMKFELTKDQVKILKAWQEELGVVEEGAIGGRWTFCFTPTSIGMVIKVKDSAGQDADIDLSDYELW